MFGDEGELYKTNSRGRSGEPDGTSRGSASSWNGAGSGADPASSWNGAGSGADPASSWNGAGSGADFANSWNPESMGEGVLHSDQALWKGKQEV